MVQPDSQCGLMTKGYLSTVLCRTQTVPAMTNEHSGTMNKSTSRSVFFFLLCILLLSAMPAANAQAAALIAKEISSTPQLLSGKRISSQEFEDVTIKDVVISNAKFDEVEFSNLNATNVTFKNITFDAYKITKSKFKNVVFENCLFLNAQFKRNTFLRVHFFGGKMTYKDSYEYLYSQTYIVSSSSFSNVLFEGIEIHHVTMDGIKVTVFLKKFAQC